MPPSPSISCQNPLCEILLIIACALQYGVVAMWGLSPVQERSIIRNICNVCQREPLPPDEVEIDKFTFCLSHEQPHMQNDTITINRRQAADHKVRCKGRTRTREAGR